MSGRKQILRNAMRVARKSVIIMDIHPNYCRVLQHQPKKGAAFLSGEPYVLDYISKFDSEAFSMARAGTIFGGGTWRARRHTIVEDRVALWKLDRN